MPASGSKSLPSYGPLLVAIGAALWATDGLFRGPLVQHYSVVAIVFSSHAICTFWALPYLWRTKHRNFKLKKRHWGGVLFLGIGNSVVGMLCFTAAFTYTQIYTVPILLQKVQPVFAVILAILFLGERLSITFLIAGLAALVGGYMVSFGLSNVFADVTQVHPKAVGFALLAALVWGFGTVFGRGVLLRVPFVWLTASRYLIATPILFLLVLFTGSLEDVIALWQKEWSLVLPMALLPGLLGLYVYYSGLRHTDAKVATFCELSFPITAVVMNAILFGIDLSPAQLVGAAILAVSVMVLSRTDTVPSGA